MSARQPACAARRRGFILLPVTLALTLIASVAFIANRDSGSNLAMVSDRSDTDKARYAAEAGLQHLNYVLQQTACAGTFPQSGSALANNSFGGASYTAFADRASGSPVLLTATGRFNGAAVTLTRANVIVYQPTLQTFTFQPDTFDGRDTHVSPTSPTTNYGSATTLRLASGQFQPLVQIGMSLLPPGSRPVPWYDAATSTLQPGAQLSMYQTLAAGGAWSADLQLVNRSWSAGKAAPGPLPGATWNTYDGSNAWLAPGQGYHPLPIARLPNAGTVGWQSWDLTDAASAWLSGAVPNEGVWLVGSGASISDVRYSSSDEPTLITQRPKLTINYLLPCGASTPRILTTGPTRDTEIDKERSGSDLSTRTTMAVTREDGDEEYDPARILAHFNLATIPPASTVGTATLRLYLSGLGRTPTLDRLDVFVAPIITQDWNEDANWDDRYRNSSAGSKAWQPLKGGTYRSPLTIVTSVPAGTTAGRWVEFNVAPVVREWVAGTTPNLGLIVLTTTWSNDRLFFNSREAVSNQPQLVVTYR